ncbi:hypothetical protein C1H76_8986 [Elsinoe australis]|uniref:Uncharacterized protein n=1 Tax=Elsinoe australis TaxID=40998 RepID=A0A4U7ATD7_9PEZI|nr:hypothetical protein C1H76_8986 [Elsinoe australis]
MASPDIAAHSPDRHTRRRPFASWVKKLTNLKSSDAPGGKKAGHFKSKKPSMGRMKNNNPYPESGHVQVKPAAADIDSTNGSMSYSNRNSQPGRSSVGSAPLSEENGTVSNSNKSAAPTLATNPETIHSDAGRSNAFTAKTGGAFSSVDGAGRNSTFSSPNQSEQSLTTTLTTIHSTSPGIVLGQQGSTSQTPTNAGSGPSVQFSHQYPPSGPVSALPPHLAPTGNPLTYQAATANNLLTDDASILTLASSSKRRRRRSMDTDASVRALAPSSVWGGSRESLPLSVLSGNQEAPGPGYTQSRPSIGGMASAERASIYSSQSVAAPALVSDRNSYYATSVKQSVKDKERDKDARSIDGRSMNKDADERSLHGAKSLHGGESLKGYEGSIRSGALGHARNDSNPGSLNAPLASPGPMPSSRAVNEPASRRSSNFRADGDEDEEHGHDQREKR